MCVIGLALSMVPGTVALARDWRVLTDAPAVGSMVYYAIVPTVIGFTLWYAGTARTSGAEAAIFMAVAPVSATVLAAVLLGATIAAVHIVGIALVVAAIALTPRT